MTTVSLEEASNKCYFHAKLFLFCATRLICLRGLFLSVMPRAIFHLTEEAKSQEATATLLRLGILGLKCRGPFPKIQSKNHVNYFRMKMFDTIEK
jgi:hypothetical protein